MSSPDGVLVGRKPEVQQFENLIADDSTHWVMAVDGLSGIGKGFLIDWLRGNRCKNIPTAVLRLSSGVMEVDLMRSMVGQIDPEFGRSFDAKLVELSGDESRQPLINYAPSFSMTASLGGRITDASQMTHLAAPLGDLTQLTELTRRSRRLDLVMSELAFLRGRRWVLFIANAEHMDRGHLKQSLLTELLPRLRASFPEMRLYISGQTVPASAFAASERLLTTLGPFTRSETKEFLALSDVDAKEVKTAFKVTQGHPLLLRMFVDGLKSRRGVVSALKRRFTPLPKTEQARVDWIYEGIINGLPTDRLRSVAPDLALFEWFDRGLLRTVFGMELTDEEFFELVRRSFVQELDTNRWTCHDILRSHLAAQRRALDPDRSTSLTSAAFAVYRQRLAQAAEKAGSAEFSGRLDIVTAALHAVSSFSSPEAEAFALSELERMMAVEDEYLYGLAATMEHPDLPLPIRSLGRQVKEVLELLSVGQWTDGANLLMRRVAEHLERHGDHTTAARFLLVAARLSGASGLSTAAVELANRAVEIDDGVEARVTWITSLAQGGRGDDARRELNAARERFGDSGEIRYAEGEIALIEGRIEEAIRCYTETIALYPATAKRARLSLGRLLQVRGDHEAALAHADALLSADPKDEQARLLQTDALAYLGRFDEMIDSLQKMDQSFSVLVNQSEAVTRALASPLERGRLRAAIRLDQSSVPPAVIMALADVLSAEGDVTGVEELAAMIETRCPEARSLVDLMRAAALVNAGRFKEAIAKLSPMVAAGTSLWNAYVLLAAAYLRGAEHERARETLRRLAERWSAMSDVADRLTVISYVAENRLEEALNYAGTVTGDREPGPMTRLEQARLLMRKDRVEEAIEVLDRIVHLDDQSRLPLTSAIDARVLYGLLHVDHDRERAGAIAEQLATRFPGQPTAVMGAATLFGMLGKEDRLESLRRDHERGDVKVRGAILDALTHCIVARKPSEDDLWEALRSQPDRIELVFALFKIITRDQPTRVQELLERARDMAPETMRRWGALSVEALAGTSHIEPAALRAFFRQVSFPPRVQLSVIGLLGGLRKLPVEVASAAMKEITADEPDLADCAAGLESDMLIALKLLDDAEERLKPYLSRENVPEDVVTAIIALYEARGDTDGAITILRRVADTMPRRRRAAQERIVDLLIGSSREKEALDLLDALEQEAPLDFGLLASKAEALGNTQRYTEVLATLDQADTLSHLSVDQRGYIMMRRGVWLRESGRAIESVDVLHKARELLPRSARLRFSLSKSLEALGRTSEAYEALLDAVALDPSELPKSESRLRELKDKMSTSPVVAQVESKTA